MSMFLVVMGVAGCGKSSLGHALAQAEGLQVIEGDDFHHEASRNKMRSGIALTDSDRDGWLQTLSAQLRCHPEGLLVTCSALKRSYRDRLRSAASGLRFVFLDISREEAHARVAARAPTHFFSATLVDSQFTTLERPDDEPDVLRVDAHQPIARLQQQVAAWLHSKGQA